MQLGSWTLNHNKHFFLTVLCSENRGRVGWSNKGEWEGWANMFDVTKWEQTGGKYKYKADSLNSLWLLQRVTTDRILILNVLFSKNTVQWNNWCHLSPTSQINNDSKINIVREKKDIYQEDLPSRDEELVKWARHKFGGVTSFTTIRNLRTVTLTGANGERCLCNTLSTLSHVTVCMRHVSAGGFFCLPHIFQPCHYGFCLNYETCIFVLA